MKLAYIFALFTLSVMVKGNLIAVAQPVLLALGSILTALNHQDSRDNKSTLWANFLGSSGSFGRQDAEALIKLKEYTRKFEEFRNKH